MSSKQYLDMSVYEATQKRLKYIFDSSDNVMIAMSGGKDSGVMFNLAYDYAKKAGQINKLAVYFLDYEAQYTHTINYVKEIFDSHSDIQRYWLALPNDVPTSTSMFQSVWTPWDKSKEKLWVRDMPSEDYVINEANVPFDYEPHTRDYDLQDIFCRWFADTHKGITSTLIGIRASESLNRFRAIKSRNKINQFGHKEYMVKDSQNQNLIKSYPIYDWNTSDVWVCNAKKAYKYNKIYDLFYKAGLSIDQMRVASPFLSEGLGALHLYRVIEPNLWGKMISRVNGVNFAGTYGGTKAMAYKNTTKPKNMTWKQYVEFLLKTLPEDARENYEHIFKTSIEFWRKRGGVLDNKTIEELKDLNINFEIAGKTNYKTDKLAVKFETYPDEADVSKFAEMPSYKRMAITILKNDHTAKYMGFTQTKAQREKRKAAIEKYSKIF